MNPPLLALFVVFVLTLTANCMAWGARLDLFPALTESPAVVTLRSSCSSPPKLKSSASCLSVSPEKRKKTSQFSYSTHLRLLIWKFRLSFQQFMTPAGQRSHLNISQPTSALWGSLHGNSVYILLPKGSFKFIFDLFLMKYVDRLL
jgi:hypothetical protein